MAGVRVRIMASVGRVEVNALTHRSGRNRDRRRIMASVGMAVNAIANLPRTGVAAPSVVEKEPAVVAK